MPNKKDEVVLDGYTFFHPGRRIITMAQGNMDEKELETIAKLYEEYSLSLKKNGMLRQGKWQWCLNSKKCKMAVYAPFSEIKRNKEGEMRCSHHCANREHGDDLTAMCSTLQQLDIEEQKKIIKEANANKEKILEYLNKKEIKLNKNRVSIWIRESPELNRLFAEIKRENKKQRLLKYPDNEELNRLLKEYDGNVARITRLLQEKDSEINKTIILKLIHGNEELNELYGKIKDSVKYSGYSNPINKENEDRYKTTADRLPLSDDEKDVLSLYQENDSTQILSDKTNKPGGRINTIISSILIKSALIDEQATTLKEAKKIFNKELIAT